MKRTPNVGTYPNNFGGLDIKTITGPTVRTAFEDGQHAVYVFDDRGCMNYEIKMGSTTPDAIWSKVVHEALGATLGIKGQQRDGLEQALFLIRNQVLANWKAANGIK